MKNSRYIYRKILLLFLVFGRGMQSDVFRKVIRQSARRVFFSVIRNKRKALLHIEGDKTPYVWIEGYVLRKKKQFWLPMYYYGTDNFFKSLRFPIDDDVKGFSFSSDEYGHRLFVDVMTEKGATRFLTVATGFSKDRVSLS